MSPESKDVTDSLAAELTSFDDKLKATANDVDMLTGIRQGINRLLEASGNNEAAIRQVLQHQYDSGALRKETFQLVKSMLDSYSTENMPTSPDAETIAVQQGMAPAAPGPASIDFELPAANQDSLKTVIPAAQKPRPVSEFGVRVGSLLRDRYLLQKEVSGGGMGVVFKAMDRRPAESDSSGPGSSNPGGSNHWVAVKILSPKLAENSQALRALQQEAAKGRCLVHPNIVKFIDLDRDGNLYFLIMEWLEGRTLADLLDSKDASIIDFKTAFRIVRQIGGALDYAHSRGIVHADIKPGNIMIMPNGDAKLFDFGVARIRQQHADAGFDLGVLEAITPAYSSMQVLTGEEPAVEDDVFSLSCLLYRLIAGYRVFGPRNAAEASQEGMEPQRLKGLNDNQWRALKKGLSNSRVTRFKSVRDFVDALDENEEEPFRVEEPDRFVEVDDHSSAGKWVVAVVLLAGLAAGAAYQYGYLDTLINRFVPSDSTTSSIIQNDTPPIEAPVVVQPAAQTEAAFDATNPFDEPETQPEAGLIEPATASNGAVDSPESGTAIAIEEAEAVLGTESNEPATSSSVAIDEPEPNVAVEPRATVSKELEQTERPLTEEVRLAGSGSNLVDFSTLPPPTEVIPFSPRGGNVKPVNIAVREDGPAVIIDFVRGSGLSEPLTLRLEEVGFSGSLSPWATGEYALSDSGLIYFPAGQARGRVSLMLASDSIREADQQSTLRLRDASRADSELAIVNLKLEDDDRRSFEARLPRNTIAFASNKATASESDAAVQIDLVRFNPDNSHVEVSFVVSDLSADDGEDYIGPGEHTISFGPGQRTARLLVPLVQDTEAEDDESFVVELLNDSNNLNTGIDQHVVVTILDDDPRIP
jgi:serine/threonine protein kinase